MAYPYLAPGARLLAVKLKDSAGNIFGEIKEWMMDVDEGRIVYVLATLENSDAGYVALPWGAMQADKESGGYRIKISKDQLTAGPRVAADKIKDLVTDNDFLDQLYSQYGAIPYWQGNNYPQQNVSAGKAALDDVPANTEANQRQDRVAMEDGLPHPNDLKEKRDEQAALTGDTTEGRTHTEHGLGSGYGAESPADQVAS